MTIHINSADLPGVMTLTIIGGDSPLRTGDSKHRPFANIDGIIDINKFVSPSEYKDGSKMPEFEFKQTIVKRVEANMFSGVSAKTYTQITDRQPKRTNAGIVFEWRSKSEFFAAHGLEWVLATQPSIKDCKIQVKHSPANPEAKSTFTTIQL